MKLDQFFKRHPYGFVAILEMLVLLVYILVGTIAYFLKLSNMALYGYANLVLTLILIGLLNTQKWWEAVGFKPLNHRRDLFYFILPLITVALNLIPGIQIEGLTHLSVVFAITLMVGFSEEVIFRGLILQALKPRGQWRAAIITAVLFGLTHAMNALAGKNMLESAMQIGYALAVGFAYAALVLNKEVIWILVVTHFLTDFVYFIQKPGYYLPPFWQTFMVISLTVGFTAYGIFLMLQRTDRIPNPH